MSTLPLDNTRRSRWADSVRRCAARAGALLLALLLNACSVGPNFSRPPQPKVDRFVQGDALRTPLRAAGNVQTFSAQTEVPTDWWTRFGSLAIDSAVDEALTGNATIEGAQAALRQSEDEMRAGAGVFYPQVDAGFAASRQKYSPLRMGANQPPTLFNLFTLSASVSYALDIWGGQRRMVEALQARTDAQRYTVLATYLTLTVNVVNAMIARAAYHDEIAATREMTDLLHEQIRITQAQVEAGTSAYAAVLALENALATLEASLPALEQKRAQAEDLLASLSGMLPVEWHAPDLSLENITLPPTLPETLPASLVRQRPDILQAEAALHVASANIGVATANLLPGITLSASGGYDNTSMSALLHRSGQIWAIAADVTAPIFHGGTLWFQRRAAFDAYAQTRASYRQVVLSAFAQVADTLRALGNDAHALDAQTRARDAAGEALRLVKADYAAGTVGYVQILIADSLCHQARIAWLQGVAQRLQDTVALYAALGGGWDSGK
ncbi:efflux transporter outer membrane subunit [Paraburkholderia graminis]|uniref:NodT family efflux transporter outer membrane factor (OMF) lipoprotein n=1 Tax=Paraburkholderia graminis TaxID=60548 RepID=A0ABD5CH78_9BURK|nr:efflux transporter outer membrane subunit [Paraburkholderia graminis]MDR6203900.1 NodT family efflux transporter outer membrane factor (OMF) lipoprotein [Paraburkholderia graminis]